MGTEPSGSFGELTRRADPGRRSPLTGQRHRVEPEPAGAQEPVRYAGQPEALHHPLVPGVMDERIGAVAREVEEERREPADPAAVLEQASERLGPQPLLDRLGGIGRPAL